MLCALITHGATNTDMLASMSMQQTLCGAQFFAAHTDTDTDTGTHTSAHINNVHTRTHTPNKKLRAHNREGAAQTHVFMN